MKNIFYILMGLFLFVIILLDNDKSSSSKPTMILPTDYITVKYRQSAVDINNGFFDCVDTSKSSLVTLACYDSAHSYFLIGLNGTNYHYCGVPTNTWNQFKSASSMGNYYTSQLKGNFDCRNGGVPNY